MSEKVEEPPIIERLEQIVTMIDSMLEKSQMWAQDPKELETALFVAMTIWCIITDSSQSFRDLWREAIYKAYPEANASTSLARPPDNYLTPSEVRAIVVNSMREIWVKLKNEP